MVTQFNFESYSVNLETEHGKFTLPFDDVDFPRRYYAMATICQERMKELKEQIKTLPQDDFLEMQKISKEASKFIIEQIDAAIGPGTSAAVFGDIIPTAETIGRFFEALIPFFEQHTERRKEFTSKYSADRVGGSK